MDFAQSGTVCFSSAIMGDVDDGLVRSELRVPKSCSTHLLVIVDIEDNIEDRTDKS